MLSALAKNLIPPHLGSLPTGAVWPNSPHSIFCNLATISDLIAYEEKEPWICKKMLGGYPRFVNPQFTQQLEKCLEQEDGRPGRKVRLLSSVKATKELQVYLSEKCPIEIHTKNDLVWVSFIEKKLGQTNLSDKIQSFLQHSGTMVFSRQAEDSLWDSGFIPTKYQEEASNKQRSALMQEILPMLAKDMQTVSKNLWLSRSGMSAVFSSYKAISAIQKKRGRSIWIQLGWLYIDSICILEKFLPEKDYIYLANPLDLTTLQEFLEAHKEKVAGVITEAPSNPLLKTPNLSQLSELCRKFRAALLLDSSLGAVCKIGALGYSDITVGSLTKYYGWSGDLIMGLAAVNPQSHYYDEIQGCLPKFIDSPYERDKQRLAFLLHDFPNIWEQINQNTMYLADYLAKHKQVEKLYWAYSEDSKHNYQAVTNSENHPGGVLSFTLKMPLADFYNRISILKGPSFGAAFSILCPFMYLAHYDLVKTNQGRQYLSQNGLNPELIRLSVGVEDIHQLHHTFEDALGKP